jgi:uncharacterized membrane protein
MSSETNRINQIAEPHFHWRAQEMTRLEAFSDAVFAFAVTLLVVSLEVPKDFDELAHMMKGFLGFAASFSLLIIIWHNHVKFLRRYGLQNAWATFLNSALLFTVLFYVYPLKFLFNLILTKQDDAVIQVSQIPSLMIIYGLGYAAVFFILGMMYVHAWRLRAPLALNEVETFITKRSIIDCFAMVGFGLTCALLASILPPQRAGLSGFIFAFIAVYFTAAGSIMGKREKKIYERSTRAASH